MLGEFGLGRAHPKQTCCFCTTLILLTIGVTAWMQTCVPFCGAKKVQVGIWKTAWANTTIPLDMQASMDTTVDPCDDFYKFACGGFIEHTGIKEDQVEWALAWDGVESRISKELRTEVEADQGKAGVFYRACMDTATIDSLGAKPLKPYLDAIDGINSQDDLVSVIAMLQEINVPAYFDWQVMADPRDPTRYVLALLDAGLTLPEAKMYTSTSGEFSKMRAEYEKVVQKVLMLTGLTASQAKHAAADAISVEMAIAKHTLPNDKLRSAKAKHYSMTELDKLAPGLKFPEIFRRLGAPAVGAETDNILCKDPAFLQGVSGLMTSPTFWAHKAYLRFKVAYGLGSDLSDAFLEQGLQVGHILTGVKHQTPRWRKCYDSTKSNLPDEVAKLFVAKHLPKANVDAAEKMLQNIRVAFRGVLQSEDWMQPETRSAALNKLNNMFIQVGHGTWQDYDFPVRPHAFLNNTNNAKRWVISRALKRLDKPVDRERWGSMDPTQVDGSYARQVAPAPLAAPPPFPPVLTGHASSLPRTNWTRFVHRTAPLAAPLPTPSRWNVALVVPRWARPARG
jgi:putative endopeptidase